MDHLATHEIDPTDPNSREDLPRFALDELLTDTERKVASGNRRRRNRQEETLWGGGSHGLASNLGDGFQPLNNEPFTKENSNRLAFTQLQFDAQDLNDDVDSLHQTIWNEQYAPEILAYRAELVSELKDIIEYQQELIRKEEDGAANKHTIDHAETSISSLSALVRYLKKIELERVQYSMRVYFRIRIRKIEKYVSHILQDAETLSTLSQPEQDYAYSYASLLEEHLNNSFLNMLPEILRSLDDKDDKVSSMNTPNLDTFVFCHVDNPPPGDFVSDQGVPGVKLEKDDIVCVKYQAIQSLLAEDVVYLI